MQRIKLLKNDTVAKLDKTTLENYRRHYISKSQAMKEIAAHNGAVEISEEYFDYLVNHLGYN